MSTVKKYEYTFAEEEIKAKRKKAEVITLRRKEKQSFFKILVNFISNILPHTILILVITAFALLYLSRWAEYNSLQLEIFEISQLNKEYVKTIRSLEVRRDANCGIEALETYAADELGMIVADEKHKVLLVSNDYYFVDNTIAFKHSNDDYTLVDDAEDFVLANDESRK